MYYIYIYIYTIIHEYIQLISRPRPQGLEKPGDWNCRGCGDLQFARRPFTGFIYIYIYIKKTYISKHS